MSYQLITKQLVTLDKWDQSFDLPKAIENISAIKIKWVKFQTATANNKTLKINCFELENAGLDLKTRTQYLLALPLDLSAIVANVYSNFTEELDIRYKVPKTVNQLNFEARINDLPTTDISASNPVLFEIAYYEKV